MTPLPSFSAKTLCEDFVESLDERRGGAEVGGEGDGVEEERVGVGNFKAEVLTRGKSSASASRKK